MSSVKKWNTFFQPRLHLSAGSSTKVVPVPTAGRGRTFAVDIAPGDLHSIAWGTALLDTSCTAGQI